jgi:hypothetical protein
MLQLYFTFILFCLLNNLCAMQEPRILCEHTESYNKLKKKSAMVYSHGFREDATENVAKRYPMPSRSGEPSVPEFPDAPGNIVRACLYTKPAVHVLATHLKQYAGVDGYENIHLVGNSCGGGTVINCLAKLLTYDPTYFDGTGVSADDATAIITAINKGSLSLMAPLLHITHAKEVSQYGNLVGRAALFGACALIYTINNRTDIFPRMSMFDVGGICLTTQVLCSTPAQYVGTQAINYGIVPLVSNMHYDPFHPTPLDSMYHLKDALTCPILLQFHKEDGVLKNPDHNTVDFYEQIRNDKTHIVISDDASHSTVSQQHLDLLAAFKQKYIFNNMVECPTSSPNPRFTLDNTQPEVEELRKQLCPNIFTRMTNLLGYSKN